MDLINEAGRGMLPIGSIKIAMPVSVSLPCPAIHRKMDYFREFDSLHEKANPPINLLQSSLAIRILGVSAAISKVDRFLLVQVTRQTARFRQRNAIATAAYSRTIGCRFLSTAPIP
jgi:hypothetical protein